MLIKFLKNTFRILTCSALISALPVMASESQDTPLWDLSTITATLSTPQEISAAFMQERKLSGFAKPLLSSGKFTVRRGAGIVWEQLQPFTLTVTMDAADLTQRDHQGNVTRLAIDKNPSLAGLATLLRALFEGDVPTLTRFFAISAEDRGDSWRLDLTPTDETLKFIFSRIVIDGQDAVTGLELYDRQGDVTRLTFSDIHITAEPPLPEGGSGEH